MTLWTTTRLRARTGLALVAAVTLAGCNQTMPMAGGGTMGGGVAPLRAAPTGQVYANQLPPPPPPPAAPVVQTPVTPPVDAAAAAGTTPAAPVQTASATPVTREGLVGAWRVTSGGGNCQIFMALTQWTGGYRAASRGCPGQVADVSAWDVSGNQVVLKDSGGSTVATLNNTGGTRYEGTTSGGQSVSLYR
ncbi:protease inhibitor Inh/omp19 family protein [Aureimonas sp. AU12]|uniref:protease inhibitor Inh/omp19 family protein n=1 Tax=Aureimonas sp. AU12 TaxID=1638161 RepID=UPI000705AD91|nr:protease inhibitor Inh/omp19 family protein [Aureimonas sp. AU12]BAT29680.1 outer membrane lipoprotein omp19 [Aureimonas sp. AU12]